MKQAKRRFHRRYIKCLEIDLDVLAATARQLGLEITNCFKPDWNVWIHFGCLGTVQEVAALDAELRRLGVTFTSRKTSSTQFDIREPAQ